MGNRQEVLKAATKMIEDSCGVILKRSSVYQTAPWGLKAQDDFLNQVICVETKHDGFSLLKEVLAIEDKLGRRRTITFGPRVIDIDVLFLNAEIIREENLVIPHPQIQNRRFVLVPMAEIAPGFVHPLFKKNIAQLLEECPDTLAVQKFQ